jgi:hypothetical protein
LIAYRLYRLDRDNRLNGPPQIFECEDDDAALIEARRYFEGHAIEIWRDDKRVGLIPGHPRRPLGEKVRAALRQLHERSAVLHFQPAQRNREVKARPIFRWRPIVDVQEGAV